MAVFSGFGSHLALVAEVRVDVSGHVRVERIVCAVDTGLVVNPDIVESADRRRHHFRGFGGPARADHSRERSDRAGELRHLPLLRIDEAPSIEVHIVPSTEDPGGVGEPGTSGAIAAVANAVFAATGKRVTTLPIQKALRRGGARMKRPGGLACCNGDVARLVLGALSYVAPRRRLQPPTPALNRFLHSRAFAADGAFGCLLHRGGRVFQHLAVFISPSEGAHAHTRR